MSASRPSASASFSQNNSNKVIVKSKKAYSNTSPKIDPLATDKKEEHSGIAPSKVTSPDVKDAWEANDMPFTEYDEAVPFERSGSPDLKQSLRYPTQIETVLTAFAKFE